MNSKSFDFSYTPLTPKEVSSRAFPGLKPASARKEFPLQGGRGQRGHFEFYNELRLSSN